MIVGRYTNSYVVMQVGDNFDGSNDPVPGPDPLDQCNGHGWVAYIDL